MISPALIWFPTLTIYLIGYLFGSSTAANIVSVLIISSFFIYWIIAHRKSIYLNWNRFFTVIFVLILTTAQGLILFPFVSMPVENGQQFIGFGGIGDYFKHSYVVTSLVENGIHAKHPFFPVSDFKYYYGYYLNPALLSSFFQQWQMYILTGYVLVTNAIAYWIVKKVVDRHISQNKFRLLVYFLAIIGYSLDVMSMILGKLYLSLPWYQAWKIDLQAGYRNMTTLQTAFWVPQHFLVAVLILFLLSELLSKKSISVWQVFGTVFFSILSSVFVSTYLVFSLGLIFTFIPRHRKNLFLGGFLALITLSPYILTMMGNGANLFSLYSVKSFSYYSQGTFVSRVCNWIVTVFSQTGLLPLLTIIVLFTQRRRLGLKNTFFGILMLATFMIVTLFLRSGGYNDFGMRSILPIQIAFPIVLGFLVERMKQNETKKWLVGFMIISAIVAAPGLITETVSAWKFRGILGFDESRLILHIRNLPRNIKLAAVGREEWIYKIPSMGFHSVLTNDFYDAAPYSDRRVNHTIVEVNLRELFLDPASDNRLKRPAELIRVLTPLPFDQLIVDENIYVKQGKNPWAMIFDQFQVPTAAKIGRFRTYNKTDLLSVLAGHDITLGSVNTFQIKDRLLPIKKGLWFIKACNKTNNNEFLFLELEDYYTLLSISLDKNQCAGNYFYQDTDLPLRLSTKNNVKEVDIFPVNFE